MIVRILIAVTATVAIPLAFVGAAPPSDKNSAYYTKRICEVTGVTGSRLTRVRQCFTQAERDQLRAQGKRVLEHVQSGPGGNPRCLSPKATNC